MPTLTLVAVTILVLAVCGAVGAPLAWAARERRRWGPSTAWDAACLGATLIGLCAVAWTWWGRPGLVVSLVATVVAGVVAVVLRRRGDTAAPTPSGRALLPSLAPRHGLWALVLAGAFLLRTRTGTNLPWVNDMGAYVNWAGQFARSEQWSASFPPFFPALLSVPVRLGGIGLVGEVLPAFGLLLVAGVLRVTGVLGLPTPARAGAAVLAAASPHLVWYSTFNASETLQAPLVLLVTVLLCRAWRLRPRTTGAFPAVVVAAGATAAALGLNRGSTLLLLVPVALLVLATLAPTWRLRAERVAWWAAAVTLGIGVGWVYGVTRIPNYYVTMQIESFVPAGLLDLLGTAGMLRARSALAWVVLALALVLLGRAVSGRARRRPDRPRRRPLRWPMPLTAVLAVVGAALVLVPATGTGEVQLAVARMGWGLSAVALLGLVLPGAVVGPRGPAALWSGATALVALLLHVVRFDEAPRPHLNYLYWDRYLVSEYLPGVLLLAAIGATALAAGVRGKRVGAPQLVPVAAAAVAVLVLSWTPRLVEIQQGRLYQGSLEFVSALDETLPAGRPVLWSSTDPGRDVPGFFPNSSWSFGSPLELVFGRDLLNRPTQSQPFVPDAPLTGPQVDLATRCSSDGVVGLVVWWPEGTSFEVPAVEGLVWRDLGTVSGSVELLHQGVGEPGWTTTPLRARVLEVADAANEPGRCG